MGRKRIFNKKVPTCFSLTPPTIKELDELISEESRSQFVENSIVNEIKRRRGY